MSSRNILNVPEVDRLADDLARLTDRAELQIWLRRNARRWILEHHDDCDRVVRDPASGGLALIAPDSLDGAVRPAPAIWRCAGCSTAPDATTCSRLAPSRLAPPAPIWDKSAPLRQTFGRRP